MKRKAIVRKKVDGKVMKSNEIIIDKDIEYLKENIDVIASMIREYKTNEIIHIDLPEADIKRTTIRINEVVWEEFNKFMEYHYEYDKHVLMAQALKEYMDKYK